MTRYVALFLANLAVVVALSANAVMTLATGCSIGGTCGETPGVMTWALAVVPALLLVAGTLWMMRAAKAGALSVLTPAEGSAGEAAAPKAQAKAKAPRASSAEIIAEAAAVEDSARSRLSRVVASNSRAPTIDTPEVSLADDGAAAGVYPYEPADAAPEPEPEPEQEPELAATPLAEFSAAPQAAEPLAVADDAEDEIYDEFLPEPDSAVPPAAPFAPSLVDTPASASVRAGPDWMWLIDPARPHHLAANAATGFPWIAGTIDLCAATLVDDPLYAEDTDLRAEASAWLEITATLPPETAIEAADGQAFVDWVNSHVGDKGRLLAPLIDNVMAGVRAEALHDPALAALLPAAVSAPRPGDDDRAMPLARAG